MLAITQINFFKLSQSLSTNNQTEVKMLCFCSPINKLPAAEVIRRTQSSIMYKIHKVILTKAVKVAWVNSLMFLNQLLVATLSEKTYRTFQKMYRNYERTNI